MPKVDRADPSYLDKLGHEHGQKSRAYLERTGSIRDGMNDDDAYAVAGQKMADVIGWLNHKHEMDWDRLSDRNQQIFMDAWLRGFNRK